MINIEPDYNYQITTGGRGYGKTFFQNRIRQAFQNGKQEGFREKDNLIKYLEDKINKIKEQIKNFDIWHEVGVDLNFLILQRQWYEDLLEKVKIGKYE